MPVVYFEATGVISKMEILMIKLIIPIIFFYYLNAFSNDIVISSQPKSIKECLGSVASLTVSAYSISNNALSFQWYKDNIILIGENSPLLKFPSLQHNQSGTYHCEISNSNNETLKTHFVSVYALIPSSITKQPEDVYTSLSSDIIKLKFEAHVSGLDIDTAINNDEIVNIQWFHVIDNTNIKLTNDETYDGVNSSKLSINTAKLPDTTSYFAEIEGKCGIAITKTVKVVKKLNLLQLQIFDLEGCEGNIETIKSKITNPHNHKLEFQWYKDGKPIYYKENVKGIFSDELVFTPIMLLDAGKYKLEAKIKDMNYSAFSNEVDVTLCSKPEIIAIRIDTLTSTFINYKKEMLTIFCKRNGASRIDVYKDDSLFVSSDLTYKELSMYNIPDPNYDCFLVFLDLYNPDRFAKYSVEIHNKCGSSKSDSITINENLNDFKNRDPWVQYRELCEGDSTSIQFFYSFNPKRSYSLKLQWETYSRTNLGDDRFYHGYKTNKLLFKNLRKQDAGIFWLSARGNITNIPENDTLILRLSGYLIKVKPKPSIKKQPKESTFSYGDKDTIINILFDNEPQLPISVELYYMASLKNTPRLIDKTEAEYGMWYRYIKDVTYSDAGYYYAKVNHENDCSARYSDTVKVTVIPKATTSISHLESNSELLIQPNPTTDFISIHFQTSEVLETSEVLKVQIFDMLGIEVISVETGLRPVSTKVDVSHLTAGVYFIKIGNKVEIFVKM